MRSVYGENACHGSPSAIFSIPRCRYPMWGTAFFITSPSEVSTNRIAPWVDGC